MSEETLTELSNSVSEELLIELWDAVSSFFSTDLYSALNINNKKEDLNNA